MLKSDIKWWIGGSHENGPFSLFSRWCTSPLSSPTWCCSASSSGASCWMELQRESPTCSIQRCVETTLRWAEKHFCASVFPGFCWNPFFSLSLSLSLAENLGRRSGVAAGCDAGLLCSGSGLWLCYCLLFLQPKEQQLPPWCLHSLCHKLPHISARHSRGVRCARLPRQREGHGMHQQVYLVKKHHYVNRTTKLLFVLLK